MQKFTTCLVFNNQAEEAINFYLSVFKDAKIVATTYCGDNEPGGEKGSVRTITFQLNGQEFMAVNGGPTFTFSDGVSIIVNCETQDEIDELWKKLSEGGKTEMCGWLQDKFGVWWQVRPRIVDKMITDPDPEKSQRIIKLIYSMQKYDIKTLKEVYEQD